LGPAAEVAGHAKLEHTVDEKLKAFFDYQIDAIDGLFCQFEEFAITQNLPTTWNRETPQTLLDAFYSAQEKLDSAFTILLTAGQQQ
jgi:hypothetical protein